MEYIISKNFTLPEDASDMENLDWFNMWKNEQFPYREVRPHDILYWYDTRKKRLVWKTEIIEIKRTKYIDKNLIYKLHGSAMNKDYIENAPDKGCFFLYKVKVIEKINVTKPIYNFARIGWERLDERNIDRWFNGISSLETTTLDDINSLVKGPILEQLYKFNEKMQYLTPQRIRKIVLTTIRNDTKFIRIVKEAANFKCQFPGCGHQIKKKDGGFYIEVAHIMPVAADGKSVLGNLLVLCPNHHKEFDYGELVIDEGKRTLTHISGILNGRPFGINLDFKVN